MKRRLQNIGRGKIITTSRKTGYHFGTEPKPQNYSLWLKTWLSATDANGESVGGTIIDGFDNIVNYSDITSLPDPDEFILHEERWFRPKRIP